MYTPTGPREAQLLEAVNLMLDARRLRQPLPALPPELEPQTLDEIYWTQDALMANYGAIGGWKIGAPSPGATPALLSHACRLDGSKQHGDPL